MTDEAQGGEAAVLHSSSCLCAQLFWHISDIVHHVSVLLWSGLDVVLPRGGHQIAGLG